MRRPPPVGSCFLLALLLAVSSTCKPPHANTPIAPHERTLSQDPKGNFVLYVSNQSFAITPVDIVVTIDGARALQGDFQVMNQHHYVSHTYSLAPGKHTLKAFSVKGEAILEKELEITDKHWACLLFWYYPAVTGGAGPTPRSFSFTISDTPMGFD